MTLALILAFLSWGSFLNSLAYRLLNPHTFSEKRSFCPHCKNIIAWYDNVPIISWIILRAKCRQCDQSISPLYPFIEIITPILMIMLYHAIDSSHFPFYFIFFSALIVTIRTDLDQMLISRFATLYLIPLAIMASHFKLSPLPISSAVIGALFGYFLLWFFKKIFFVMTKQEGIGQGDLELLAFIGSFTGVVGCWTALTVGSITGTIIGCIYMLIFQKKLNKIPFGPFLSFGSIIFVFFQNIFINHFIG